MLLTFFRSSILLYHLMLASDSGTRWLNRLLHEAVAMVTYKAVLRTQCALAEDNTNCCHADADETEKARQHRKQKTVVLWGGREGGGGKVGEGDPGGWEREEHCR